MLNKLKSFLGGEAAKNFLINMLIEELFKLWDSHISVNNKDELVAALQDKVNMLPEDYKFTVSDRESVKAVAKKVAASALDVVANSGKAETYNHTAEGEDWFDRV